MSVPSDIHRNVENIMIYFFYVVGSISLLVNCATLMIIIRKSSALTTEIRIIAVFQQLSCLLSNAFLTILFVPFFYVRMGGGFCVGALCSLVPYQYLLTIQVFLTICMICGFGMMIIARHQCLVMEDSPLKVSNRARYAIFFVLNIVMHLETLAAVLALPLNRTWQNAVVDLYYQIKWRERGLNWFLFYGPGMYAVMKITKWGALAQLAFLFALVIAPFSHMLHIVLQARKRMLSRHKERDVHIHHAQTIIIQFALLLVFIVFPFVPAVFSSLLDDVYRDSQTAVVIAEMVFVCSTLLNSIVVVLRTRSYRSAVANTLGMKTMNHRPSISVTSHKAG